MKPIGTLEQVILTVNWKKSLALTLGPTSMIIIAALLFSQRDVSTILSVENWTTPTITRPSPLFSLMCVLLYFLIIGRILIRLAHARGRYLWVCDGWLMSARKKLIRLRDIDPNHVSIKGGYIGTLTLKTYDGITKDVNLAFTSFDSSKLMSDIHAAIRAALA